MQNRVFGRRNRIVWMLVSMLLLAPFAARAEEVRLPETDQLRAAVLMEAQTGTRLWAKEADTQSAVAGLSKLPAILTLAQAFDEGLVSETAMMRVSAHAAATPGPTAFLEDGEQIAASELIKAAVMISAGDAILTLGENAFGSESVFCDNIAVTLKQLGLNKTLPDALCTGMTFTAWELSMLGMAARQSGTFCKYCTLYLDRIAHADGRETELVNANRMINNYSGCSGLLTGSSPTDGYSGAFLAERSGTCLVAVVIGASSAVQRTACAVALLDYGFANFRTETLAKPGTPLVTAVPVRSGDVKEIDLVADGAHALVMETAQGRLKKQFDVPEYLEAPLNTDTVVGSAVFQNEKGEPLAQIPLFPAHDVEAFGVRDILLKILARYVS